MAIWAAIATATVGATRYFNRYRYFDRYRYFHRYRYFRRYTERFKKLLQLQLEMADEERGLVASEMTGVAGSTRVSHRVSLRDQNPLTKNWVAL